MIILYFRARLWIHYNNIVSYLHGITSIVLHVKILLHT